MGDPLKTLRWLESRTSSLPKSKDELIQRVQEMLTAEEERVNAVGSEADEALQLADRISTAIEKAQKAIEDTRRVWAEVK